MLDWITQRLKKPVPPALAPPDSYEPAEVADMLREIGVAMVETSQPVQVVEQRLLQIGARYTTETVQASVMPTLLLIQIGTSAYQMETSVQGSGQMNMAAKTDEIINLATAGAITPKDAVEAVREARMLPPRFGPWTTTLGYALTSVGFGMVIDPSWRGLLAHLFLGLVVGLIVQIARPFPNLAAVLPTLSAVVVTLLATWFVADVARSGLLRVITPALIATLPGMTLVIGSIELAGGRIISGSSRTMYGLAQMGLLIYGVVLGVRIAGEIPPLMPQPVLGPWTVYASILVIAVGLYIYLSAPKGSFFWLLLTIAVANLTQTFAGQALNIGHSGFIAAMVAIPFAVLSSQIRGAPPATVLTLAAFWSLVPGQLTFMSLGQTAAGDLTSLANLSVAGAAIISIALGALVGWTIVRTVSKTPQRPVSPSLLGG